MRHGRLFVWFSSAALAASMTTGCSVFTKSSSSCCSSHSSHEYTAFHGGSGCGCATPSIVVNTSPHDYSPIHPNTGCTSCGSSMAHGGHIEPQMVMPQEGMSIGSMPTNIVTDPSQSMTVQDSVPPELMISPSQMGTVRQALPSEMSVPPKAPTPSVVLPMPTISTNSVRPLVPAPTPITDKTAESQGWKTSSGIRAVSGSDRTSSAEPATETQRVSYSEPGLLPKTLFDRSRDYSYLVGTLEPGRQEGTWCVRFCPLDEEDRFGGSVTLTDIGDTSKFSHGQWVRVEGQLVDPDNSRSKPEYKVQSVKVIN